MALEHEHGAPVLHERDLRGRRWIAGEVAAGALGRRDVHQVAVRPRELDQAGGEVVQHDRPGLEQSSCECYATVKATFARLMPEMRAAS